MLGWSFGTGATTSAAHAFNLDVNGVDLINSVDFPSIRIQMPGPGDNGSLICTLTDPTSSINIHEWDEVRFLEHAATRPILFGGFVQSVKYSLWATAGRTITLQCVGYGILLDKKIVTTVPPSPYPIMRLPQTVVAVVNAFGGRITALCAGEAVSGPFNADATYSVADPAQNAGPLATFDSGSASTTPAFGSGITLRSFLDTMTGNANYRVTVGITSTDYPATAVYWVDSAGYVRLYPDIPTDPTITTAAQLATRWDSGTVPGLSIVETSGTYTIVQLDYEREDTDRITAAYVIGASAPGTGYHFGPSLEHAGDLITTINSSSASSQADIDRLGGAVVAQTTAATARGTIGLQSSVPLDAWPGRNLEVTSSRLTLDSTLDWRITSTAIAFRSTTTRIYTIGFGGNIPKPSAMRRTGRFSIRARVS